MLERLVDSWLDSASERSYQAPFCQMLAGEGHKIVHSTRHAPIEFGKDVITIAPDGVPCAFQLKGNPGGRLTLNDLRSFKSQLLELATQPIVHPGIKSKKRHRCYLVTNGQTDEEVHRSLDDINQELERGGFGEDRIELWSRGHLYDLAVKLGVQLWPSELDDLDAFLSLLAHRGDDLFPAKTFHRLIAKVMRVEDDGDPVGSNELKRRVTSAALLTAIVLRNATLKENHYAIATAWTMFVTYAIAATKKHQKSFERTCRPSVEIAKVTIHDALASLCGEITKNPNLMSIYGFEIAPMYKARSTLVWALMSIYWLWSERKGWPVADHKDFLIKWMPRDFSKSYLWGQGAVPQFMCHYWYLNNTDATWKSEYLLAGLTGAVISLSVSHSADNLVSPYFSYEDVARHLLANFLIVEDPLRDESATGLSFMAEGLLHSLVRANFKQHVKLYWPDFSRVGHKQFVPDKPWKIALIHSDYGEEHIYQPTLTKLWSELEAEAYNCASYQIPTELADEPFILMLFVTSFPYRATPEALWHLGAEFGCIWDRRKMDANIRKYRRK